MCPRGWGLSSWAARGLVRSKARIPLRLKKKKKRRKEHLLQIDHGHWHEIILEKLLNSGEGEVVESANVYKILQFLHSIACLFPSLTVNSHCIKFKLKMHITAVLPAKWKRSNRSWIAPEFWHQYPLPRILSREKLSQVSTINLKCCFLTVAIAVSSKKTISSCYKEISAVRVLIHGASSDLLIGGSNSITSVMWHQLSRERERERDLETLHQLAIW